MQPSLVGIYRAMAYNNAWANHRLLSACLALSQQDFVAPRTGFFPSIAATLNHILIVDWFYIDALEGGWLGPKAWADRMPCTTAEHLKRTQAEVDARLVAHCDSLIETGETAAPLPMRAPHVAHAAGVREYEWVRREFW